MLAARWQQSRARADQSFVHGEIDANGTPGGRQRRIHCEKGM
jgi:hypothetical protein